MLLKFIADESFQKLHNGMFFDSLNRIKSKTQKFPFCFKLEDNLFIHLLQVLKLFIDSFSKLCDWRRVTRQEIPQGEIYYTKMLSVWQKKPPECYLR